MTASIIDFLPGHSIGINDGRTEAGWLISPAYANNQERAELRYVWRPIDHVTLDVRGRYRDQLEANELEELAGDRFDFYARITRSFDIKKYQAKSCLPRSLQNLPERPPGWCASVPPRDPGIAAVDQLRTTIALR